MSRTSNLRIGGHILADQLRIHGVDMAFGVPGESYLALLDGLYDVPEVRYVICRQEGPAAPAPPTPAPACTSASRTRPRWCC
jgi:acetolactate synthase-1/2/3 large subunit